MTLTDETCTQPHCDCFRVLHAFYCATVTRDLVPGYWATADGKADAADQRRMDKGNR